jgi:large-conductance mechanosensitive channel
MKEFLTRLLEAVKQLLTSKKVLTLIVGMIVAWAARHGMILDSSMVNDIVVLFVGLLLAQGAHDWGKGAAQVTVSSPPPASEPVQTQTININPDENLSKDISST